MTHIWQAAVGAPADLWLVHVDEDARVSSRTASTIARYHALVHPLDRLLVDEINGRVRTGLFNYRTTMSADAPAVSGSSRLQSRAIKLAESPTPALRMK